MKSLFIAVLTFLIQFSAMGQDKPIEWNKITLNLKGPLGNRINGSVTFELSDRTFEAVYDEKRKCFVFDSLPNQSGILNLTSEGFEAQSYQTTLDTTIAYSFYLGPPGSEYLIKGKYLYPFSSSKGSYLVILKNKEFREEVREYLDSLGLLPKANYGDEIETLPTDIIHFPGGNKSIAIFIDNLDRIQAIRFQLLNHPGIIAVGQSYSSGGDQGYVQNQFNVVFADNVSDVQVDALCSKYKLKRKIVQSQSQYMLEVTQESIGSANEIAKQVFSEEIVEFVTIGVVRFPDAPSVH